MHLPFDAPFLAPPLPDAPHVIPLLLFDIGSPHITYLRGIRVRHPAGHDIDAADYCNPVRLPNGSATRLGGIPWEVLPARTDAAFTAAFLWAYQLSLLTAGFEALRAGGFNPRTPGQDRLPFHGQPHDARRTAVRLASAAQWFLRRCLPAAEAAITSVCSALNTLRPVGQSVTLAGATALNAHWLVLDLARRVPVCPIERGRSESSVLVRDLDEVLRQLRSEYDHATHWEVRTPVSPDGSATGRPCPRPKSWRSPAMARPRPTLLPQRCRRPAGRRTPGPSGTASNSSTAMNATRPRSRPDCSISSRTPNGRRWYPSPPTCTPG